MTCSIPALSCCQKSPASSCTISIITVSYFWLLSASQQRHPSHASPGTKDTNSSLHSLVLAAAPICAVPLPAPSPLTGVSRHFSLVLLIFPGRRLAIQSFMWEASCWHPEYMSQICPASLSDPSAPELRVSNLLMGDGVPASSAWNSL